VGKKKNSPEDIYENECEREEKHPALASLEIDVSGKGFFFCV